MGADEKWEVRQQHTKKKLPVLPVPSHFSFAPEFDHYSV
jgi:hypothetical protein